MEQINTNTVVQVYAKYLMSDKIIVTWLQISK